MRWAVAVVRRSWSSLFGVVIEQRRVGLCFSWFVGEVLLEILVPPVVIRDDACKEVSGRLGKEESGIDRPAMEMNKPMMFMVEKTSRKTTTAREMTRSSLMTPTTLMLSTDVRWRSLGSVSEIKPQRRERRTNTRRGS